jgi:hypothetical protein
MVVWIEFIGGGGATRHVARRVGLDAQPVGPAIELTDSSENEGREFDLSWNPLTNEFGVVFVQKHGPSRTSVDFARISADGIILTKTQVAPALRAYELRIAVNSRTGEYVLLWWDDHTFGAEISQSGRVVSRGIVDANAANEYRSLAFNPISETFLAAGSNPPGRLVLSELNQYGAPMGAAMSAGFRAKPKPTRPAKH